MSHDDGFDARLRGVHAQSLDQLSPRVQAQLAQRRRAALQGAAPRRSHGLLPWAGMATAGLALALVVQLRPPASAPSVQTHVATSARPAAAVDTRMAARTDVDAIAPDLSEDPEFYLWLGDVRPPNAE
ncbi:hypothetical protein [Cognatilysobacter segetis]|uniref:hypothetical protein n=1 Tax=Cognatilysobacter segetis TaxID=2492394 RepID=UPI00105DD98A|nr:hypothetical protein [Lysobacter segetis]